MSDILAAFALSIASSHAPTSPTATKSIDGSFARIAVANSACFFT